MERNFTEAERYYDAQKRVTEMKKFYEHLAVYLLCNAIVIVVNLMTSPDYLWCIWCVMGWGFPLVLHGLKAFDRSPFFNKKWEERKIRQLMEEEKNQRNKISSYGKEF